MISEKPVTIRVYEDADYAQVADLFIRVNRLRDIFSETGRNVFWVVEAEDEIIGMFGIECHSDDSAELRRMYLDRRHRGRGIAQSMLQYAETRARELGFAKLILSTAEVQEVAIAFYRNSGYRLVRTERAETMSAKMAGDGLTRLHFEKVL